LHINQGDFHYLVKVLEKNINFADDIENHQPSERISSELVNGYRRNTQAKWCKSRSRSLHLPLSLSPYGAAASRPKAKNHPNSFQKPTFLPQMRQE
ncbi:MAG: hypothetical protein IJK08_07785, partial [Prevotella sp.]|nr:hypothetical protein [Prevotella sp.]